MKKKKEDKDLCTIEEEIGRLEDDLGVGDFSTEKVDLIKDIFH